MGVMQQFNRILGERMASSGRMAMIEVTGRKSGRLLRTPVGYVANDDGTVWLGAGRAEAQWAKNLLATPTCRVKVGDDERAYVATRLDGPERERAMAAIHGKYGAPAARVGTGPVFVLRPAGRDAAADAGADGAADAPADAPDAAAEAAANREDAEAVA